MGIWKSSAQSLGPGRGEKGGSASSKNGAQSKVTSKPQRGGSASNKGQGSRTSGKR